MNQVSQKKQLIFAIIGLFLLGLIVTGGSYAFWAITDNNTKAISFNSASGLANYIEYDAGESKFVGDFNVSSTYNNGIHSTIALNKTASASNIQMKASINMDINSIGTNMKISGALKWVVTEGTSTNIGNVLANGNFIGANNGDTLTLVPNLEVTTTKTYYTVWIWLDASENPSDALSGETLDTVVWTQIDQSEGTTREYAITRINANYQSISATVVSTDAKVTHYAITNNDTTPSMWESIPAADQSNVYNLNVMRAITGTYYIWFKNEDNEIISDTVTVSSVDTTGPTCTFGSWSVTPIRNNTTSTIELTCTDDGSGITIGNLTPSDLSVLNNYINITNVTKTSVTNGYKYTITVSGKETNGVSYVRLPDDVVKNAMGYGNSRVTSSQINVVNSYTVTFTYFSGTGGSRMITNTNESCTITDNSGTCTLNIPTEILESTTINSVEYAGLASTTGTMTAAINKNATTLTLSQNGNHYYAVYSSQMTLYYPDSSSTCTSSNNYYRNHWFLSTTNSANPIISSSPTSTTSIDTATDPIFTSVTDYEYEGFSWNLNDPYNTTDLTTAARHSSQTIYVYLKTDVTGTFYYNSSTAGDGTYTIATATATADKYLYCRTDSTAGNSYTSYTVPAGLTDTVGPYGETFRTWKTSVNISMDNPKTSSDKIYAMYTQTVTMNQYLNGNYITRNFYRHSFFANDSGNNYIINNEIATVLTAVPSSPMLSNSPELDGPNGSTWYGLSTGQDTTREYSSYSAAAHSTNTTFYTIYKFNVNYSAGSNVSSIGANSGECLVTSNDTSCDVTLPSITPNTGYTANGWTASAPFQPTVGAYVTYTPSVTSYTTDGTITGHTSLTFNPSELTLWRVLSINQGGTVDLISENVSSVNIHFLSSTGYRNFVGYLNVLASQYETSGITVGSRHFGYNGQTEFITDTQYFTYPAPWACTTNGVGGNCNPDPDDYESSGGGDMLYTNDYNLVNTVLGTTIANKVDTTTPTSYWMASRLYYRGGDCFYWTGRYVTSSGSVNRDAFISYYDEDGWSNHIVKYALRPIVTLSPTLSYSGNGTSASPYVITGASTYTSAGSTYTISTNPETLYANAIDDIPPTVTISTSFANNTVTATVSASDSGSGLAGTYYYKLSNSSTCDSTVTGFVDSTDNFYNFNITDGDTYYVCVKVPDNAGNDGYISDNITVNEYTGTFYYNSNTTSGSLTAATETASCMTTSSSCTITVPTEVSSSVGKYNSAYHGVVSATGNMGTTSTITLTNNATYYANYSSPLTIYYQNSSGNIANSATALYRNEYFTSTSAMSTITATANNSTTQATTATLSNIKGTLEGINATANTTTSYAVNNSASVINSGTKTYYAVSNYTQSVTATFYYSKVNDGTVGSATASGNQTRYAYCTSTTAVTNSLKSEGTITAPTLSDEVAPSGTTRVTGYAGTNSNMSPGTTYNTGTTKYYAAYRSNVSIVRPSSASGTNSCGTITVYRNAYINTASPTVGTTKYAKVLATATTGTSNMTSVSGLTGTFKGYSNIINTSTPHSSHLTVTGPAAGTLSTYYAISTYTASKSATFYYSNSSSGGKTNSSVSGTQTRNAYCSDTTTAANDLNAEGTITAPSTTVPYGTTLVGWATSASTMSTATVNTGNTAYYAVYRANVTNYYYNSSYTSRTLYRNGVYGTGTNYTMYLSTSSTGTSNYSTATGPGSSVWSGLSTAQDTTSEYSSVAAAATSTATSLYTVYQFNVTYAKGSNVSAIGATSGSCKVTTSNTSCTVTTPTITPSACNVSAGWSTTNGATSGTGAGSSYTLSSNATTVYCNGKAGTTFYVSSSGNDSNSGTTTGTPFATISKAYSCSGSSITIKLLSNITQSSESAFNTASKAVTLTSNSGTYTITRGSGLTSGSIIALSNSGTLTVTNIIFNGNNVSATKGVLTASGSSTMNLNSGVTVQNGKNTAQYAGGGVVISSATLNVSGATITANKATNSSYGQGGGIYVNGGTLNFNSGTVSSNDAPAGGGIFVWNGTANIKGGTISNNGGSLVGNGGGIWSGGTSALIITGGNIQNNTAASGGGGVWAENGSSLSLSTGTISGNSAPYGGGICFSGTVNATMSSGSITGNTGMQGAGIGLFNGGSPTINLNGGTISNNTSTCGSFSVSNCNPLGGGVVCVRGAGGVVKVAGVTISSNTTTGYGGGIFLGSCTVNFSSGSVINNKCTASSVCAAGIGKDNSDGGTYNKTGGTLSGNTPVDYKSWN